ncbi:ARM repeat superfamily protein [Raphanus sativus]|nr:ARM repeat superfamily protein [Raphanus sativus]
MNKEAKAAGTSSSTTVSAASLIAGKNTLKKNKHPSQKNGEAKLEAEHVGAANKARRQRHLHNGGSRARLDGETDRSHESPSFHLRRALRRRGRQTGGTQALHPPARRLIRLPPSQLPLSFPPQDPLPPRPPPPRRGLFNPLGLRRGGVGDGFPDDEASFLGGLREAAGEALFSEQEVGAQVGAALCLAAAIDAAEDPDPARLGEALLPRVEKLVRCKAFKAKSAGVVVIGSVIGAGGAAAARSSGGGGLRGLVDCLVGFLSSEDWAARKAAAEALGKLATVERNGLGEFKAKSLKIFETKRYDKVKAVREVMSQMIEAWRQVPDLSEEVSPPRSSNASSKGDASDGRHPLSGSRVASTQGKPRTTPPGSSLATTTARKRTSIKSSSDQKKSSSVPARGKSNVRRRLDWKAGGEPLEEEYHHDHNENTKEVSQSNHEKMQKLGSVASSVSGGLTLSAATVVATVGHHHVLSENQNSGNNCKGFEDMSLIRSQLVQIEQQQSNLMDLLQRFVGSSQDGMRALETRVHGLELAMDEISYDLAVSNGRMSNGSSRNNCCLIPPGSFIRSKFWKKSDQQYSASRLATHKRNMIAQTMGMQDSRQRFNGAAGAGFIVNPLAETRPVHGSAGIPHN